jgi:hypothetical protein
MKYFLHDTNARNDEKVTLLFIKFGYEGLGLFYSILEILGSQEKPVDELVLKSQLKIGKRLEKHLNFMYIIEILSLRNGDVFNENLLNFSEKYQIKKEKTRKKVSEWREKQLDIENVTSYVPVSNHPKVKESKVKDIYANQKSFYKKQLDFSTEKEKYQKFIDILFGENDLKKPLDSVLCLKDQVDAEQFSKLLLKKTENKTFTFVLQNLENTKKYTSGKKSLYLILVNWFKTDFK